MLSPTAFYFTIELTILPIRLNGFSGSFKIFFKKLNEQKDLFMQVAQE
jgi:hypothetical protein